jgi:hypothetical protein
MKSIDLDLLFKLRLCVARFGEMDVAKWWNTQGILGRYGALALQRGFPKSHRFAQAKIAFAVAAQRCREIYPHPNAYTLWALPPETEDQFNRKWHDWVDAADAWVPVFQAIEDIAGQGLLDLMLKLNLVTPQQLEQTRALDPAAEGNSTKISSNGLLDDHVLILLAAGYSKGQTGKPVVPYLPIASVRR